MPGAQSPQAHWNESGNYVISNQYIVHLTQGLQTGIAITWGLGKNSCFTKHFLHEGYCEQETWEQKLSGGRKVKTEVKQNVERKGKPSRTQLSKDLFVSSFIYITHLLFWKAFKRTEVSTRCSRNVHCGREVSTDPNPLPFIGAVTLASYLTSRILHFPS